MNPATLFWWQIVVLAAWALSRRVRRLERHSNSTLPPWTMQLGALKEAVTELQLEYSYAAGEQADRLRRVESTIARLDADVRAIAARIEEMWALSTTTELALEPIDPTSTAIAPLENA